MLSSKSRTGDPPGQVRKESLGIAREHLGAQGPSCAEDYLRVRSLRLLGTAPCLSGSVPASQFLSGAWGLASGGTQFPP